MRREDLSQRGVELGGLGCVVGEDEGRFVVLGDDLGKGVSLSGSGHAEERLILDALGQPGTEFLDGRRLVPGRLERGDELDVGHRHASLPVRARYERACSLRQSQPLA